MLPIDNISCLIPSSSRGLRRVSSTIGTNVTDQAAGGMPLKCSLHDSETSRSYMLYKDNLYSSVSVDDRSCGASFSIDSFNSASSRSSSASLAKTYSLYCPWNAKANIREIFPGFALFSPLYLKSRARRTFVRNISRSASAFKVFFRRSKRSSSDAIISRRVSIELVSKSRMPWTLYLYLRWWVVKGLMSL